MRVLVLLIFTCILSIQVFGQDQIVTTKGDTLDCKINRITKEFIHFAVYDQQTGIILMRSRLPLSGVQSYYQAPAKEETDSQSEASTPTSSDEELLFSDDLYPPKIRLAISSGYTYQFGGYRGFPNSYKRQLESLWNLGGEIQYFITENFGIGVKYSRIATTANEDFEPPYDQLFGISSLRDEEVRFNYIGLSITGRQFLYDDQIIYYFLGFGSVNYRTDLIGDGIPLYQEGDTFGLNLGVSYDFAINQTIGIGIGAEVNIASLNQFDNNGTVVPADFDVSRVDITAGIRFFK